MRVATTVHLPRSASSVFLAPPPPPPVRVFDKWGLYYVFQSLHTKSTKTKMKLYVYFLDFDFFDSLATGASSSFLFLPAKKKKETQSAAKHATIREISITSHPPSRRISWTPPMQLVALRCICPHTYPFSLSTTELSPVLHLRVSISTPAHFPMQPLCCPLPCIYICLFPTPTHSPLQLLCCRAQYIPAAPAAPAAAGASSAGSAGGA
jgi:hypothetical protein